MARAEPSRPRVLVDADVLFAGAASPSEQGANLTILRMAEIILIKAVTPQQVITEAQRNLAQKLPQALPAFQLLVHRCLTILPDPLPQELAGHHGLADPKDLPMQTTPAHAHRPETELDKRLPTGYTASSSDGQEGG